MRYLPVLLLLASTVVGEEFLLVGHGGVRWFDTEKKTVRNAEGVKFVRAAMLSPDDRHWLQTRQDRAGGVWILNADGTGARRAVKQTHVARHAVWAADGISFTYVAKVDRFWQLFHAPVAKEPVQAKQLTDAAVDVAEARLSPKGGRVAFLERPKPQRFTKIAPGRLIVMDLKTGERKQIHEGGYLMELSWSPDGKRVAVSLPGKIEIHDAATGKLADTIDFQQQNEKLHAHAAFGHCWKADGTEIACRISFLGGRTEGTVIFGDDELFFAPINGALRWVKPAMRDEYWIPVRRVK